MQEARPVETCTFAHHQLEEAEEYAGDGEAEHRRLRRVGELAKTGQMLRTVGDEVRAIKKEADPGDPARGAKEQPGCDCRIHRSLLIAARSPRPSPPFRQRRARASCLRRTAPACWPRARGFAR